MSNDPLIRYLEKPTKRMFSALVRETRGTVLGAAYRVLGDRAWAEDVTQEVFVKLLVARWKPEDIRSGPGLLAQQAIHLARTQLRSAGRRASRERVAAERRSEAVQASSQEVADVVRNAVSELPEPLRDCVELRYFGGLRLGDVAAELGWPLRTVKHRLKQAKDRLQPALQGSLLSSCLPYLGGDGDEHPHTVEPSSELDAALERLGTDGPAHSQIATGGRAAGGRRAGVRWLAAAAVIVGVAILSIWAVSEFDPEPSARSTAADTAAGDTDPPTDPSTGPSRTSRSRRPLPADDASAADAPEPGAPSTAAAETDDEAPPTCTVVIRVLGPGGDPVEGARARVEFERETMLAMAKGGGLREYDALRAEQTVDRTGQVTIEGVPVFGSRELLEGHAWASGYGSTRGEVFELIAGETCELELWLSPSGSIPVTVLDSDTGEPVANALVRSTTEATRRQIDAATLDTLTAPWQGRTDHDGLLTLSDVGAGPHTIRVHAAGYRPARIEPVRAGEALRVQLDPVRGEGVVIARVRGPAGDPVAGMKVQLSTGQSGAARTAETNALGEAHFDRVPAGVSVMASLDMVAWTMRGVSEEWAQGENLQFIQHTEIGDGETAELLLGFAGGDGRVVICVVDQDEASVEGASVSLFRMDPVLVRNTTTDAQGRAVFENVPTGSFRWSVDAGSADWNGRRILEVSPGSPVEMTVETGRGRVAGRVLGPGGAPVADAAVELIAEQGVVRVKSEGDGRYVVEGLPPGAYPVRASTDGRAPAFAYIEVRRGADPSALDLTLGSGRPVTIVFTGALRSQASNFAVTARNADGRAITLGGIAEAGTIRARQRLNPGRYRVTAENPDGCVLERDVVVTAEESVRIVFDEK